jgi:hypothetical protein
MVPAAACGTTVRHGLTIRLVPTLDVPDRLRRVPEVRRARLRTEPGRAVHFVGDHQQPLLDREPGPAYGVESGMLGRRGPIRIGVQFATDGGDVQNGHGSHPGNVANAPGRVGGWSTSTVSASPYV